MNKKLNDVTPSEWDRAARSNIPQDMTTEEGRQSAWEQFANVGLEAWAEPAEREAEEISLEGCTTEIDWGEDEGMEDLVNHPTHYNSGGIECIEAIEASMELEAFQGYLKGNILKYIWRMSYKGKALEDCEKSQWYLNKLISTLEENT
jgi:phosphoribosylformimino-5-aminoimidazole carboxamide ribonucleotide (ProFAR) isomerase